MRFRSLAIATMACILAACGPGDGPDPAAPGVATAPTATPALDPGLVAAGPGALPADPGVAVDVTASSAPDQPATAAADLPASTSASPSPSPSPSPTPTATPTPTPSPTPTAAPALVDLQYTVTSRSHNTLIFQKFSCTVEIKNGSSVPRTGKVTATFVHNATPEDGSPPISQVVSLPAGGTVTLTFADPTFHPLSEDVAVQVATDPYVPSPSPSP
jgi:hypothetical protein